MPAPTVEVTITLDDGNGTAYEGVVVTARLDQADVYTAGDESFIISDSVTGTTDANGTVVMDLFPNHPTDGLGTTGSTWYFSARPSGSSGWHYAAQIPNTNCNLADLTNEPAPSNPQSFAASVRTVLLTGLSTATATAASASDTLLQAIGKLQAQISGFLTATVAPPTSSSAVLGETGGVVKRFYINTITSFIPAERYGAVGNNVADDTEALREAITATAVKGGTVLLEGKYKITGGLDLESAVTLFNPAGQAERSNTNNKSAAGLYCSGTGYDAVTVGTLGSSTSAMQAGLKGIAIFNAPQAGIVTHSQATTIDGCSVVHSLGSGIVLRSGTAMVNNTHVIGPAKNGIEVLAGDNRIVNCEVQQPNSADGGGSEPLNTYDCIYATAGPLQVIGGRFGDDVQRSRHGLYAANAVVRIAGGAEFQNNTMSSIYLLNGAGHNISGCNILSNSVHASKTGITIAGSANGTFVGNHLNGVVSGGIGAINILSTTPSDLIIVGNYGYGNWAPPDNFIVWTDAVRLAATKCLIQNGHIPEPSKSGPVLSGATPSVSYPGSNSVFWVENASPTTVTDLLNGYAGQEVSLFAVNGNTTIQHHNSYIRLLNKESWTMPAYSILRLKKATAQKTYGAIWYEVSRVNGDSGLSVGGATLVIPGTGSPEGVVTAPVGCLYLRKDGGANTTIYVKESGTGNTGWVAK